MITYLDNLVVADTLTVVGETITTDTIGTLIVTGSATLTTTATLTIGAAGKFIIGAAAQAGALITNKGTITASGGAAYGKYSNPTLVAAANSDTLTGINIVPAMTPGSFTGLVVRGLNIAAFSVAAATSPGTPSGIAVGIITGTGASVANALLLAPPTGATTNYLISHTTAATFNVLGSGAITTALGLTFGTSLLSTTALATPSALSATQFTGFASTVSGAAIMGYGTTNDVALMNRAGTVVAGVLSNATTFAVIGLLTVSASANITGAITATTSITSSGTTFGIGYATGAGSAITQSSNKGTGVTNNFVTQLITMNNAALNSNTTVSFVLTNSAIAATDHVQVDHVSGGTVGSYNVWASPAAGSATITVRNITGASLSEAIALKVTVIKAVIA